MTLFHLFLSIIAVFLFKTNKLQFGIKCGLKIKFCGMHLNFLSQTVGYRHLMSRNHNRIYLN